MGKHEAVRLSSRELRSAYLRLLAAYERLLRDHRELEAAHASPGHEIVLWQEIRVPVWDGVPMDVDTASALVRATGMLTSPGLEV